MQGVVARESRAGVKGRSTVMLKLRKGHVTREVREQQYETFFENLAHSFIVGRIRVKRSKGLRLLVPMAHKGSCELWIGRYKSN